MKGNIMKLMVGIGSFILALLSSCGNESAEKPASRLSEVQIENSSGSALAIGRGVDTFAYNTKGKCVLPPGRYNINGEDVEIKLEKRSGSDGQAVSFGLKEVQSFESLAESMSVNSAASFSSGIYNGSASASYFKSSNYNGFSSYLLVHVKVVNSDDALNFHYLTPDAKRLYGSGTTEEIKSFQQACGDSFISQKTTGGEFYAIVEFRTTSREHKERVSAKLRAGSGVWGAGGSFKRNMQSLASLAEMDIKMIRVGGAGPLPQIDDQDEKFKGLIDYALNFPASVGQSGNPWTVQFTSEEYTNIPSLSLPNPDLVLQKQNLEDLAVRKRAQKSLLNEVHYILANPSQFKEFDASLLGRVENDLASNLSKINTAANMCLQNPSDIRNCTAPLLIEIDFTWPERKNEMEWCEQIRLRYLSDGSISTRDYDYLKETNQRPIVNDQGEIIGYASCRQ